MAKSQVWVTPSQNQEQKDICFSIRQEVFVEGQNVPPHEEWDELDKDDQVCPHFIAWTKNELGKNIPIGTARLWLHTSESRESV